MSYLKNHPFAVEAYFESSKVLTFAVPKTELQKFIPPCLSLDTFQDQWAFIAIAFVKTKQLRPKGFPKFLGNNFTLIGYRIFVRYQSNHGKNLRGLYIIKSETNSKIMKTLGSIFTHYNYKLTDILTEKRGEQISHSSNLSNFKFEINQGIENPELPKNSPFSSWKEARRFAGPLPFTFTYNEIKNEVLIIEGVRTNWTPKPIAVDSYQFQFLDELNLQNIHLANAFEVNEVPYYWKKGKVETWK